MSASYSVKFQKMKEIGELTTLCLNELSRFIDVGKTTKDIDNFVVEFVRKNKIGNAQYGYRGFPAHCCTSINHVMCHGLPSEKDVLKQGDIFKVDLTFSKDGYLGDACRTYGVGRLDFGAVMDLIWPACGALDEGIKAAVPGNQLCDVGIAIENYIKRQRPVLTIAKEFVGHGINTVFHDRPIVYHTKDKSLDSNLVLTPGLTFTIEPIIVFGKSAKSKVLTDGWTVVTRNKSPAAQFEATIGIIEDGNVIFCR